MTVTAIINCEDLRDEGARCAKEGFFSLSLVDIPKSDKRYIERIGTYIAAASLYSELFSRPMPDLYFDEYGKPYFREKGIYISLSHRPGVSVVCFSDTPSGVDVERDASTSKLDQVRERLLSRIKGVPGSLSVRYMTARLGESGELFDLSDLPFNALSRLPVTSINSLEENPVLAFTALEAAAKCTGLGISRFLGTGADISGFFADSILYRDFTVTTFIKKG